MAESQQGIGIFTTDEELVVRSWDAWLTRVTGLSAEAARGQPLAALIPGLEARGLLGRFQQVLSEGVVVVLAPAFHSHLIACPPEGPARYFEHMQQRVTIAPLRDQERIAGTLVTVEDVTARRERERELAEDLASPDTGKRLRAAQELKDEPETPAQMLVDRLGDPSWRVRQAAASGLAQRSGGEVVAALVRALRDDHRNPSVLNSALQALALSNDDTLAPLLALLDEPDPDLRGYVVLALGEQRDPRATSGLLRALEDPDINVRYHAIEALGKLRSAEAIEPILAIAESRDFFLAFPALDALAQIGDTRAAGRLVPLLDDQLLSAPAIDALGQVGDIEAAVPLALVLNTASAPALAVARALARIDERYQARYAENAAVADLVRPAIGPAGVQSLLQALPAPAAIDGELPEGLVRVLSWLEGPLVDRALAGLLAHPGARGEIVEALVARGARVAGLLIEQLDGEQLEVRQAAAVALGRIGHSSAVPALVALLADQAELASVAASALAKIGDRGAFEPLLKILGHPVAAVRQAAIGALNSLGHPDLAARVGGLLYDNDPHVRESAVKIAGYFGYPQYAEVMLECCRDQDERVRRAAIEHLPYIEHAAVIPALVEGLHDPVAAVRAVAARACAHVEAALVLPGLLGALADADAWVRYYAARSAGRQGMAGAAGALGDLAGTDAAPQVRLAALEALGQIGGERAAALLVPFAQHGDLDLARAAIEGLGRVGHPIAQAALIEAVRLAGPAGRAAAEALGSYRSGEAVAALQQAASGGGELAQAAIRGLARIPTPEAAGALVELTAEPALRQAAVAALVQLGHAQIDGVARGLAHQSAEVRRAVVEALERMRHPLASEHICAALDDPEAPVRLAAAVALGHLGSPSARRLLEALAQLDPDAAVRRAAYTALER